MSTIRKYNFASCKNDCIDGTSITLNKFTNTQDMGGDTECKVCTLLIHAIDDIANALTQEYETAVLPEIAKGYMCKDKAANWNCCYHGSSRPDHSSGQCADVRFRRPDGSLIEAKYTAAIAENAGLPCVVRMNRYTIHVDSWLDDAGTGVLQHLYYDESTDSVVPIKDGGYSFTDYFATNADVYAPNSEYDLALATGNAMARITESDTVSTIAEETEESPLEIEAPTIDLTPYLDILGDEVEAMMSAEVKSMKYVGHVHRFFGAPARFLKETDPPIKFEDGDGKEFEDGRTYTKNIAMEAPLVHFIPGLPTYLSDISNTNRDILSNYIREKQQGNEVSEEVLKRISGVEGRYFDFVPAFAEYIKYVNLLCRNAAIYMGIGDKIVPGTQTKYKNYNYENWQEEKDDLGKNFFEKIDDWDTIVSTAVEGGGVTSIASNVAAFYEQYFNAVGETAADVAKDIVAGNRSVKMYVDAGSSFSENVSNTTTQSQIAGMFDTGESMMKEVQFWGGASFSKVASGIGNAATGLVDSIATGVLDMLGMGDSNLVNLANYANYIISGSNIVFPEMWTDASYSKSYRFSVDLISPYGDSESIFMNIIVPLMFILGFSLPRQTSANSFTSPMLVRVVSKGWFSCDMGIIDGISIEKGGSDAWNASGLPLSMKIDISVKDLYTSLSIAKTTQPELYFNNPALIEFLAATCGVDTIQPNLKLKIMTMMSGILNIVTDIPSNLYNRAVEGLSNFIMSWSRLF